MDIEKIKQMTGLTLEELIKLERGISLEAAELLKKAFPHNEFVKLFYGYKKSLPQ